LQITNATTEAEKTFGKRLHWLWILLEGVVADIFEYFELPCIGPRHAIADDTQQN